MISALILYKNNIQQEWSKYDENFPNKRLSFIRTIFNLINPSIYKTIKAR